MENNSKKNTLWVVLGVILAVSAMCVAAYAIARKIGKKKAAALDEAEELPELDIADEETVEEDVAEVTE